MVLPKGGRGVPWVQLGGGNLEVCILDYNTHPYLTPHPEFRYEDSGRPVGPNGTHGVGIKVGGLLDWSQGSRAPLSLPVVRTE